ncbi:E3 ubiquitin-protein ligase RNF31 isoform X3 [Oenanthe melanoleuca]|uniref:E3 ubiquitin-protein ligase RNF31 isoform X3 n=1 Tax=Oenanthe melanoleuca TaxID=2939378 RepID=UPI0024C1CEA9|nr:E3 ubiquitin-protein ligase RNF31 isoform X3 [Oenanthe melanoleuca]
MPDPPKPPPDLGSLQALRDSLELSLLLSPSGPDPPELHPVLRLPLSPTQKLRLIRGAQLLTDNLSWSPSGPPLGLDALRTALNILEKYGRNLLSPRPPRHWRAVRFGNPVFRSTVGAIQGGRDVLKLLGYTEESGEGLSFPPPPQRPHPPRVATVTADVLVLRAELDLLQANQHPNPQFFTQILLGQGEAAESQGLPPESLGPAPFSEIPEFSDPSSDLDTQIRHFRSRLGGVLKALLDPTPNGGGASLGPLSLAEAAWAWLEGEGRLDHARCALIGRRKQQLRLLSSLGFPAPVSSQALQRHHGCHWGALRELQRLRLHPFHLRHFQGVEPGLDFNRTELQALVRQILASLPVASWGRALLVATLGRELGLGVVPHPSKEPLLVELVEAVGSCADRAALRRRLRCECAVCGWGLPRQLMQWLPGCSCPLCPECFRLHFTVGVRERGVGALGCPSCGRPDLRDEAERLWYWSTLEPQLRQCLDPDTFGLVTRKLTELELLKDPQFLWCPHCSFGFIFEAERGPAQCPQCHKQCCPRCQLPWDPRHSSLSCTDFGSWLRSRETPGPSQGLGAFLGEMGIECPQCGQCFALARGGCLHFQCSQCQHQFCAGCGVQFHQPGSCPSPQCHLRGSLHGHHPRDCLFYLRDWAPDRLQQLLTAANVAFETEPPPEAPSNPTGQCPVQEQKELGATLRDENCGRETAPGQAGLCRGHYTEYLVSLINRHGLDPAPLYTPAELRAAAQRHLAAGRSHCRPGESEAEHLLRLRRMLGEEAPIRPRPPRAICK